MAKQSLWQKLFLSLGKAELTQKSKLGFASQHCSSGFQVQTGPDWSDPPVPTTGSDQLQGTPAWGGSFRSPAQGERCENAVLVWDSCLIMITPSPAPFLSSSTPVTAALGSGDSPWSWRQSLGLGTVPGGGDSPRMCRVSSRGAGALLLGLGTVPGALLLPSLPSSGPFPSLPS